VVGKTDGQASPEPKPKTGETANGGARPTAPRKKSKAGLLIAGGLVFCLLAFTCCGGVAGGGYYLVSRAKRSANDFASQMAFGDKDFQAGWDKALKDAAKNNALGGSASGSPAKADPAAAGNGGGDLDGTYAVIAVELLGQKAPKNRLKMYSDYVFSGNTMSYSMAGTKVSGTIKVDGDANPARLDFTSGGKTSYCIYKIEGDSLTLCMGGTEPSKRPTEFKTSGNDLFALLVLKRK